MSLNAGSRSARDSYLDALPDAEQARILRQAERVGPLPDDSDWLVAYATQQAATRMEAAIAAAEIRLTASPRTPALSRRQSGGPWRELVAFAASMMAIVGVTMYVNLAHNCVQSVWLYCSAIAIGVGGSALYVWLRDRVTRSIG